jgi:competence protein ComEC
MNGLVPGAMAAWAVTLCATVALAHDVAPSTVSRWALIGAAIAAVCALAAVAGRRWTLAAPAAVAVAALMSSASYATSMGVAPLQAVGSTVTVEATVIGDMRLRTGGPQPVLDVRAHLRSLASTHGRWEVGAPILLRLPPEAAPPIGARVAVTGTLREGDVLRGVAARIDTAGVEVLEPPGPLGDMTNAVRGALRTSLEGAPPRAAALVEGLAVGDETGQSPELAEQMRVAGLSHLTAVSGGNTSIVVGAVLLIATLLGLGLLARVAVAAVALGAFVVIVGPQPSVLRASVMGMVALLAVITGTRRTGMHALAFAVVVLLVLSPALATAWGFALSVTATAGLIVFAAPLVARWGGDSRVRRALVGALALTIGAQVATLPLMAAFGDGLSLVAVPANVLAAPAVAPVTVLGLLAAITGTFAAPMAGVLARGAEPFAAWIAWVAGWTASWPAATLPWPGGLTGAALAGVASLALGYAIARHRGRHERAGRPRVVALGAVLIAAVAVLALRVPERAGWPPPDWLMVACDVGQGDAVVLRGMTEGVIVVDAGPDPVAVNRCLSDLGVDRVDFLVLSHHHADHVDGVPGVQAGRDVRAALVSPLDEPVQQAATVRAWLSGAPVVAARAGQRFDVDGIAVSVLWPQRIIRGPESAPNNASVVLLAEVRGVRILLLGDVEVAAQVALRTSLAGPGVDVVKVAHHGSRYQDPALASWSGARVAVISAGVDNRYGHPAPETVRTWLDSGAVVARTDEAGDVAVVGPPLGVVTRGATPG